jgi:hypothetical protein
MRASPRPASVLICLTAITLLLTTGWLRGQPPVQPTQPATSSTAVGPATSAAAKKRAAARRHAATPKAAPNPSPGLVAIPLETAPPSAPATPAAVARQKGVDRKLLEQQQAQSARDAQITDRQVQQAQQQRDSIQKQVRIQDAPGPTQTGVVPAAGTPVAPVNSDDRIQDAPGPAQTLPKLPATQPSTTPPQP